MQTLTTYAKEIAEERDLLHFMQNNRVNRISRAIAERVLMKYRKSTLEAARIPADWFSLDCQISEYA